MTDEQDDWIEGDNPLVSLSHDQKIQFTTARYFGALKPHRSNATEAIRSSEFDISKLDFNKNT